MNLTNFLKQTDSLTAKYTAEQMASYKEKYSRKNVFRAEMKAYGWRG